MLGSESSLERRDVPAPLYVISLEEPVAWAGRYEDGVLKEAVTMPKLDSRDVGGQKLGEVYLKTYSELKKGNEGRLLPEVPLDFLEEECGIENILCVYP